MNKEIIPSHSAPFQMPQGVSILPGIAPEFMKILTPQALSFVAQLHRKFQARRLALLARRKEVLTRLQAGHFPEFLKETQELRESNWTVAPIPHDILDRRVEITGPVDRKMVINALNSGAQVFMADFEDSHSPTWKGTLEGQINLYDAVRRNIRYVSPDGKNYDLNARSAVLFVRPRGWHLVEKHVWIDGSAISASFFDFGLFFYHNAKEQLSRGTRPYFYLPKMESHLEARLWNDVFVWAQTELGIAQGTIRATVLIETILASFEMNEILYELKDHSAGLNCGRWDYIFSFIKKFSHLPEFVFPDRSTVTMNSPFLKSYDQLLIQTCHRRQIHAMGGMAAQIPIRNDVEGNALALEKVRLDKLREVGLGHDGTWVAHPGLVPVAKGVFDQAMPGPNQIRSSSDRAIEISAKDLLQVPAGDITREGLVLNSGIALQYLESWLRGSGCVPLNHLMEDAATAEISRAQIWQWIHHGKIKTEEFLTALSSEKSRIQNAIGSEAYHAGKFELASHILTEISTSKTFVEFLTIPAYEYLD